MAEESGKIEKPEAGQFQGKRKLYLIPPFVPQEGCSSSATAHQKTNKRKLYCR